jgi:hypothetical protein
MSCSETTLFQGVRGIFDSHDFHERAALSATYFAFSTWFSESLPIAPCLFLTGAAPEARLLLELLECVVHKPLSLSELTRGGFLSIDISSAPTLLIQQNYVSDSLWSLLRASIHRDAQVSTPSGVQKIYCAKAIYLGNESNAVELDDGFLRVDIAPSHNRLPILEADERLNLSTEFQSRMRAFQERYAIQVRDSKFDLPEFSSPIRILVRALGAPMVAVPELQIALGPLLREYQDSMKAALWFDPTCVVIEAALFRSHQDQTERIHVGEIANTANAILTGRGETLQLEAKEAGLILRKLGLLPKRDKSGFAIRFDETIRQHIHHLANQFGVATVQEGVMSCAHCAGFVSVEPSDERHPGTIE